MRVFASEQQHEFGNVVSVRGKRSPHGNIQVEIRNTELEVGSAKLSEWKSY